MIKETFPLDMRPIQRRRHANWSATTVWNLDTACKLIKYKFVVSGIIDGHSRKVVWLKYSSNNRVENACDLFLKAARDHVIPFQGRGYMYSENKLLSKHMILLCNTSHNGYTCCRSARKSRIERFGHKYNTMVKDLF